MKTHKFIVEIELPEGVNVTDMKDYIDYSVSVMCGSFHPMEDPLFDINRDSVKVVHATRCKVANLLEDLK